MEKPYTYEKCEDFLGGQIFKKTKDENGNLILVEALLNVWRKEWYYCVTTIFEDGTRKDKYIYKNSEQEVE